MDIANVSLPPDLEEFVSGAVASGKYSTKGELVREALLLLRDRERLRDMRTQELRKEVPEVLEGCIRKMMAKDSEDRHESMEEVITDLRRVAI